MLDPTEHKASPSIIEELIKPNTLEEFKTHILFKEPFAKPFQASKYKDLVDWDLLNEILKKHNNCWVAKKGILPKDESLTTGKLSLKQAKESFESGHTILVRHSEFAHPFCKKIADDFQNVFKGPMDVQIFVTPGGEEGFGWHYDTEEVFIIQSTGEKAFRMRSDSPFNKERSKMEFECVLKAGDWLYIPSGYWHKAKAITDSFHLSIGVTLRNDLKPFTEELKNLH